MGDKVTIEETARELKSWLIESYLLGEVGLGVVGPLATLLGDAPIVYREAAFGVGQDESHTGRIVVFTDRTVLDARIKANPGRNSAGDIAGTVQVKVLARRSLRNLTTDGPETLSHFSWSREPSIQWPWPLSGTLTYADDSTIKLPLNGNYWSASWTSELLPHLLDDLTP